MMPSMLLVLCLFLFLSLVSSINDIRVISKDGNLIFQGVQNWEFFIHKFSARLNGVYGGDVIIKPGDTIILSDTRYKYSGVQLDATGCHFTFKRRLGALSTEKSAEELVELVHSDKVAFQTMDKHNGRKARVDKIEHGLHIEVHGEWLYVGVASMDPKERAKIPTKSKLMYGGQDFKAPILYMHLNNGRFSAYKLIKQIYEDKTYKLVFQKDHNDDVASTVIKVLKKERHHEKVEPTVFTFHEFLALCEKGRVIFPTNEHVSCENKEKCVTLKPYEGDFGTPDTCAPSDGTPKSAFSDYYDEFDGYDDEVDTYYDALYDELVGVLGKEKVNAYARGFEKGYKKAAELLSARD